MLLSRDFMSQEHEYHMKDPRGIEHRGLNTRFQEHDKARRQKTLDDREAYHTTERETDLTQVQGPREEVKPLLLPSCIAPRGLARYNKFGYRALAR
jgi:hypothetical protein